MTELFPDLENKASSEALFDFLYRSVDFALSAGRFADVDSYLRLMRCDQVETSLLIGVLTITRAARDVLHSRSKFFWDVHDQLMQRQPDRDRIRGLLIGLE